VISVASWFNFDLLIGLYGAMVTAVIALGIGYFSIMCALGAAVVRRHKKLDPSGGDPAVEERWNVFALIPCLNEERVIGATVHSLVDAGVRRVVVIDDASDDRTGEIAARAGGESVLVVRRQLPEARLGKGPALNYGLATVLAEVADKDLDPDCVIICVMDADGRLSESALSQVLPLFNDPSVGGSQLAVQIRRTGRLISLMQDFEFWGSSAVAQFGRNLCATVSLGGNGQFTRLSALLSISETPWGRSMTEDLELALRLLQRGWHLKTTPKAWVTQQGVDQYRRLIRQRARWFQGHMACARYLWGIWRSRQVGSVAVMESTLYLSMPWLLILPWSLLFHVGIIQGIGEYRERGTTLLGGSLGIQILVAVLLYLISFAPMIASGCLYYWRCRGTQAQIGFLRALTLSHLLVLWNYVSYCACWIALARTVRGRRVWDKTARSPELASGRPGIKLESAVPATESQ
jgi:cellulose synthase/poly-beta-1,6-N-acetylglucosamine synthase-like glycosyltransferase